jgi:iron complex outermembrane recepter protein
MRARIIDLHETHLAGMPRMNPIPGCHMAVARREKTVMAANLKTRLYCSAAAVMFACVGSAQAQEQSIETVVVTGQRAAIQSAIKIKENASQIVDSVSAEDVGKLPDNSVTEVLQRIAGVNIARIQTGSSSENYLGEGTGVTIRGLTSTVSLLNGRDSFSAASGRNLAWEDIPPELAQGIDVYKSLTATLPEGGFGGVVNLRTRLPFDFDGFSGSATLTGNFADLSKKGHLGGVGLISDRWNTKIGEIGLLFNIAYSDLTTQADGVQVLPYYPTVYNQTYAASHSSSLPSLSDSGSTEVYVPNGFGFNRRTDDRVRQGLYAAAQWRPNDRLEFFLTAFNSRYTMTDKYHDMALGSGALTVAAPGSTNTFDANNSLLTTSALSGFMYADGAGGSTSGWAYQPINYIFSTKYQHDVNSTTDVALGGEWHPSDKFSANFALQLVDSSAKSDFDSASVYAYLTGYGLTVSPYGSSTLPTITEASDTVDLTNASNYYWNATMPHKMHNYGREVALYLDTIYDLSDTGIFRKLRSGVKLVYRGERDNETNWNYRELSPYYVSTHNTLKLDTSKGDLVDLSDLFGGATGVPSALWFPSFSAVRDPYALQQDYGVDGYTEAQTEATLNNTTLAKLQETSLTAYAMLDFAQNNDWAPISGNVGVRVVAYRDQASGYHWTPELTSSSVDADQAVTVSSVSTAAAVDGGHKQVDVLPSLNIQFQPTDPLHIRFAFSQAVNRPTFAQMNPRGNIYGTYAGTYISYFSGSWGNPDLKPEKAEQIDASIEYYFPKGGLVHFAGFYKQIHNFISSAQATEATTFDVTVNSGSIANSAYCSTSSGTAACTVNASITEYINEKEAAQVRGFEVGIQKYADFLPDPFDGFGVDFNFTYIDSSQPGAMAYDMKGKLITGLPLTGLSKNTLNIAGMYDKGPFSLRVAYNWRSQFLVSTASWQTAGIYNNVENINYGSTTQQGTVTQFSLPVFQYPQGTLDANLTYNLTDNISWTLEASNLTRSVTRLFMMEGYTDSGAKRLYNRSWYQSDTRYTSQIRVKF